MANAQEYVSMDVISAMQTGQPYKTYVKTILAKVQVNILNPFSGKPELKLLTGDPRRPTEDSLVKLWSETEYQYFINYNKKHIKDGTLILYKPKKSQPKKEDNINSMDDEELEKLLNSRFFSLQQTLNKFTSEAPVFRLLTLAEEMEKSDKIIAVIKARLSELQEIKAPDGS